MALSSVLSHVSKLYFTKSQNAYQVPNVRKHFRLPSIRSFSDNNEKSQTFLVETELQDILRKNFPSAEYIEVRDVSGGCGAMFEISVIAEEFKGLTVVKQHRLVNEALKKQIKDMHGLRIHTALPSKSS